MTGGQSELDGRAHGDVAGAVGNLGAMERVIAAFLRAEPAQASFLIESIDPSPYKTPDLKKRRTS